MPGQRGQIFGAIYQPTPEYSVFDLLCCQIQYSPQPHGKKPLLIGDTSYQLISATSQLAATVNSILELAYLKWRAKANTHIWSEALPYYGQHPID